MGRNRKPQALREIEGIPSKARRKAFAIEPNSETPTAPAWLAGDALKEWNRITPVLAESGHLARIDRAALVGYCSAWALFVAAARDVSDRGVIVAGGRNGEPVKNPAVAVMRDAGTSLKEACKAFGLTPAARAALPVAGDGTEGEDATVTGLFS